MALKFILDIQLSFLVLCLFSTIYIQAQTGYKVEKGTARYYADYLIGQPTAYGEIYDQNKYTCAHPSHRKGTILRVTNLDNQSVVMLRVNDRGPYCEGCVLDVSKIAAVDLGLIRPGKANVKIEVFGYSDKNPTKADQLALRKKAKQPTQYNTNSSNERRSNEPITMPDYAQGFVIQLASYNKFDNAVRQLEAWRTKGINFLYIVEDRRNSLYKLVIGPYPAYKSAEYEKISIKKKFGLDGLVVRL